jgi:hypothetical protein
MKAHWGSEGSSNHSSTSTLDGGKLSASRPGCFIPRERARSIHWIGSWMGNRAVLDSLESNPKTPIVQPIA